MILSLLRGLLDVGMAVTAACLFILLALAIELGFRLGQLRVTRRQAKAEDTVGISTLTAGMLGLLAFTLSLSINFAQNRYEARRDLVVAEANGIGTAWLRAKLIDGDESSAIARKIEDYARTRLAFTVAASDADALPLIARADALQSDIWEAMRVVAHRSPSPVTTALITALNTMFDNSDAQRFAYQSSLPADLVLALFFGALLTMGALGYQYGVAGQRLVVLWLLLVLMWSGGILLIIDLSKPRMGDIHVEAEPLVWAIQVFDKK
jgi:hypothetical protein